MDWLAAILGTVLKFGAEWIEGWYAANKAKADEWAARTREAQLASLRRSADLERQITAAASKPPAVLTPQEWNLGTPVLLLVALLFLTGCDAFTRYVYIDARLPIIKTPFRPPLALVTPFNERELALVGYATALEAAILSYNQAAAAENIKNGY